MKNHLTFRQLGGKLIAGFKNGNATAVIMGVIALIAVAISIIVGYIVLVQVVNNVPSGQLTASQQTNLTNISTQLTNAFMLTTVLPIVLVAGLILGGFFAFFHFRGAGE